MDRGSAQQFPYSGNLHLMPFKDNFFTPCKEASARMRPFAAQREGVEQAKKKKKTATFLLCCVSFLTSLPRVHKKQI
jgi:hypothetical protein